MAETGMHARKLKEQAKEEERMVSGFHIIIIYFFDLFNPILTGLFESKFLLGGGVNLTPPSDLGPEGADRREILHGCQDTCKEYCYKKKLAENVLFIILL